MHKLFSSVRMKPPWRNGLACWTSNSKVVGSSPTGGGIFIFLKSVPMMKKLLGPVHTNPFSNENEAVLLRIRLSSTLQRRKRSPKTEPFENAPQSGAI